MPVKPFLKWAGGKRQLLHHFAAMYPPALKNGKIKHYYEPFLGSGAVFFDIAQRFPMENAYLSDINSELVLTYQVIQSSVAALIDALLQHQKKYRALDQAGRLNYFYDQRDAFNRQGLQAAVRNRHERVIRAAQLIFLNRTCYNGLFRVNARGAFNTPAGDYKNPSICDPDNLLAVSKLLSNATIKKAAFTAALKNIPPASFVYLDPPYRPLSKTASFTAYNQSAFGDEQQKKLAAIYKQLSQKGAAVMLSNSDSKDRFFDRLYAGFTITRVPAKRLINTDASKRGLVNEIVVTNFNFDCVKCETLRLC